MEGGQSLLLILMVGLCFHSITAQRTVCTQEGVADIVFMVDGSWSIGTKNFEQIRQFLYTLVNSFDVGPDRVRIGLVQYSTTPRTEFLLNTYQNKSDILDYISRLPYMGGGTETGLGLDFMMREHFIDAAGSRAKQNVPQIAVVITDGKSQDNVESHANELKKKGIVIYAIGIKEADEEQLREIANLPHSQHVYSVSDFTALQGISLSVVQTLCTTVEEAKRQLLQLSTECAAATKADIVFLVDGSSSIGSKNFADAQNFLRSAVEGLDIGPDKVRIGLAQYSDEPHKEFLLKDHMDKQSLLTQISSFPYLTGGTQTGEAIKFINQTYFTEEAGSRANQRVPQIAVVITDGDSTDDVIEPAKSLREKGVMVFAIGVGQANVKELQSMANKPSEHFVFHLDNYQALLAKKDELLQTVCVSMEDQRQALAEKFSDIFFLLDGGLSSTEFGQVRNILVRLSNQLKVGASAHRLGLAFYGQDTRVEFFLNSYQTKEDIQSKIKKVRIGQLQPNEKRNLGNALEQARTRFLIKEAGSRADQGYQQYLVVFSGQDSNDDVDRFSHLIKSEGVTVAGVSLGVSSSQMKDISTPGYYFQSNTNLVPSLKSVFEGQEQAFSQTQDCRAAFLADIVFIVDESGSIGTKNFQLVRTFLHTVISGIEVGSNRVRLGIVTYSAKATAHVYLDSFDNKKDLLNFVKILPYRKGGTQTGAALNFTRENVFVKNRGSRKDKGVQQVAVVITDGKSDDDVSRAAAELRRTGVTIYSVGIKNATKEELVKIVSHPPNKHIFMVNDFTKLRSVEQTLQKILCQDIVHQAITVQTRRTNIKEECLQTDEADIFFLIDQSGSIHPPDFYDMKKFIFEFLNNFRIGPQHIRVGIVKYADDPVLEFDLTTYSDVKTMKKAVEDMLQVGGGTETGKAITFMGPQFDRAEVTRGYKVSEYLVVITDGQSTDDVKVPAKKLQSQGVTVYAIGVQNADQEQLREIAGDPKRTFFVNDFDALNPIKDNIITDICSTDACKDIPGDLVFLIDSSGSIDSLDYEKMKEFMKTIISRSAIGIDDVHIGVMQYSTKPRLEFSLSSTYNKDEMNTAVDKMQQIGGGTHTGQAITAVSQLFDGGRSKLRQRLVVITDGESQDAVAAPAEALRAKGVAIYAIGVVNANTTQLLEISGSSDKMYSGRDFDALKDLENQISLDLCAKEGECRKTQQADVIFLVDGSTSISLPKFRSMQKFMSAMVNQTTVGKDLTRFGVILYSTYPKNNFTLETYGSKKEVLQAIQDLTPPRGDTYTGLALEYSLDFFSAANGGRAALKVPQVLMVITDGEATDPHHLEKPSMALRNNGISVFSIGVEEANKEELEIMAGHDASKIFYVDNFDALETLYKNLSLVLCNSTKPVCEKQKADLVFLLDQSGSITTNDYTIMKKFTTDLIKSFKVGEDLVRVGLAQFSDTFQHEFYLDKFYSEQEVTKHIMGTVQTGGGTKIGKALDSIRDYFQASRGGRRSSGISQNLVLITDGDSQDEVLAAAERLRALKVEVFVIGIGHVQVMELLQITGTPDRLFTVQNFGSLEKIKDKVVDTICKSKPIENPSGCTIDVAMGFDISRRSGTPGEMLVSGHTKLQALLPEIGHYASSVSELCCSKPDLIRTNVGYRVVGRNGQQIDDFKFEAYSEEVLRKVMTLNLKEPTYFNSALLKSFGQKFKAESGAGVKVLIIFSDGLDEDVMRLEQESELLRKSNINALLVVALEGARNPAELQMVEFGRGFGYKLPLSIGMPSVGSTILKQIDAVSNRECCSVMCKCSGHEGVHGSRGHPGSKGVTGQKGYPGFPGEEGVAGERGFPGPSGPQGLQGCSGNRGTKGNRGLRGNRGDDGEDGLDGVNGEQGMTGKDGVGGERGRRGDPGIPGIRGEAGLKGQRGLRGDPGEPGADKNSPGAKGESGNPGLPGPPGSNGQPGESGVVGNQGPDGRRGAAGEKGAVGPPGDKGQPGIDGPSGSRGPQGIRGQPGPKGIFGLPGPQGAPGAPGEVGGAGRRGAVGQKGQPGDPGVQGGPGQQGARGPPGQDGRDGYGPPGAKGAKGDPGFPGYPGLVGETGPDGSKGFPGPKGNRGRNGNSGPSGETGLPGAGGNPGHTGSRGPPGVRGMTECQLITYIRDNCACSFDRTDCPAFPTELVIGLDMSEDVAPAVFERQRSAALALLEDVGIAESNCPTGARVAVVGYSAYTRYLVRFQDYRHKKQLIEFVKNIAPERTTNQRHLAAAMRFVAHNVFKRVRSGMMMRKVAVFFSSGPSQDVSDLVTAVMEYRGLNIVPAIVSTRNAPGMRKAMELDDSGNSIFTVLGRDMAADLRKVKNCAICYDPCRRSEECGFIQGTAPPQDVDVDLAMVVDSSREVQGDQYTGFQELLGSIVEQLAVSSQPRRAGTQARVAVVQQSGTKTPKVEFSLQTYQDQQVMRTHLLQKMHQLGGASYLGLTLNYTLTEVLKKATNARRKKLLLVVVGTQTAHEDHALLQYVSNKVKCEGVAVFVLTVGDRYSRVQVEELASVPVHQHLIHLDRLKAEEQTYTQRFFRVFLNALNRGVNTYSTASIKQACERVEAQEREQSSTYSQSQVGQWAELETVMAEEPREQFQQQTRGRTQTGQIDVMDTLLPGDAGFSVSGVNDAEQFLSRTVENNFPSKEACFLRQDPGGCQSYNMMWFFDPEQSECSRFWYGGCGGNGNRFTTQDECESLCLSKSR